MRKLGIAFFVFVSLLAHAQSDSLEGMSKRDIKRIGCGTYKQKFNVRITPVFYHDIGHTITTENNSRYVTPLLTYGAGLHVQAGPCIRNRYFPNLSIGIEAGKNRLLVPVYADFYMNILQRRVSPTFHVGAGYIFVYTDHNIYDQPTKKQSGFNAVLGFGIHVAASRHVALVLYPDYRFIYYT
ncbi:MAG TPA: hypothetical protein VK174_16855, partial [Chitinophagales bacterium]|nr:hypothetical protein [Chitinophagales bacterium]